MAKSNRFGDGKKYTWIPENEGDTFGYLVEFGKTHSRASFIFNRNGSSDNQSLHEVVKERPKRENPKREEYRLLVDLGMKIGKTLAYERIEEELLRIEDITGTLKKNFRRNIKC